MATYKFRNLVFEGGGVKGIAYVGVLQVLEEKKIIKGIKRVGGTSAGAINSLLLALGYELEEQEDILKKMNFEKFMDGFFLENLFLFFFTFGWYRGRYAEIFFKSLIFNKTESKKTTFAELQALNIGPELSVIVTNLSRKFSRIYSAEYSPDFPVAKAVRMSMSMPLFFAAVKEGKDVYVDGGVFRNYPIKLYDHKEFIRKNETQWKRFVKYYKGKNQNFPDDSDKPYIYNRQTLGFRLDTRDEIELLRDHKLPREGKIKSFVSFLKCFIAATFSVQEIQHLHSDDWKRTVYVDTHNIKTTQFKLTDKDKNNLVKWGREGADDYFKWLTGKEGKKDAVNLPGNNDFPEDGDY